MGLFRIASMIGKAINLLGAFMPWLKILALAAKIAFRFVFGRIRFSKVHKIVKRAIAFV